MLVKSGLFLFLLAVLQVSARYKSVEPDFIENEIIPEPLQTSSSRIVSGWLAERGQFPYHASLRFVALNNHVRQCGGAIVSNEWIVSSASCTVERIRAVVHAGGVIFTNTEYFAGTTEWYNHPRFQSTRPEVQSNDISLVKLQQPIVYTTLIQPIRIQSRADANRNYDGQQVIATGNGNTGNSGPLSDVLRWVYLRAISNSECSRLYPKGVWDTTICARYFNVTSQATCYGDNGGPLVHVDSDGVPTLIGVSLFFSDGCDRNLPSGFIRPGHFLPWFQEVTGINFDQEATTTTTTTTTTSTTPPTPIAPTTTTTPTTHTAPTTTTTPITTTTPTTTTTSTTITTPTTPEISSSSTTTTDSGEPDDPDDSTPVESTTAPPTESEEQEPEDVTPEENITAPPEDSEEQEPDDVTPEDNTVAPPEDSEDTEEDKEDDSDCSESNENDEMGQLVKRLQVDVKVKVRFDKYNLTDAVGNEIVAKH